MGSERLALPLFQSDDGLRQRIRADRLRQMQDMLEESPSHQISGQGPGQSELRPVMSTPVLGLPR